jgi:multiple sugar transport system substrate-binding protein
MKLKQMMKKTAALTCIAACGVSLLTGCSSASAKSEPAEKQGAAQAENTDTQKGSGAPVEITFTVWDYGTTDYWKVLVEAFEKENPDIKVKVTDIGGTDYDTKIPVLLSSGDTSDVITIKSMPIYTSLVEKNQLMPLDAMVEKSGLDMAPYYGSDEGIKIGNQLYGLPFRNDYYLLYYNKTLFDKAGVDYPSNDMTWDEYRELAKKLTSGEGNDKVYGSHLHTWPGSLYRWGMDKDHAMDKGDYQFLKPVYELFLGIQNEDKTAMDYGTLKTGNVHYSGPFYKEQVAMEPMGTWFANLIINAKNKGETSVEWGAAKAPHFEGQDPNIAISNPTPIAINKNAAHPEEAWRFIQFMCSEPGADILASLGTLPAYQNEKTINTLVNVEGMPEGFKEAITIDSFVLECQMIPQAGAVDKVISEEHDLIMLGAETIDDGLDNMAKRVQKLLNK